MLQGGEYVLTEERGELGNALTTNVAMNKIQNFKTGGACCL